LKGLAQARIRQQVQESSARTVLHSPRDSQCVDPKGSGLVCLATPARASTKGTRYA
jgi:hypothetical protein